MKKLLSAILLIALLTTTACSTSDIASDTKTSTQPSTAETTTATEQVTEQATDESGNAEVIELIEHSLKLAEFEGIVYITKNGEVVYQSATGDSETQEPLAIDSLMPVGSVSKQFCAAAILMLRDQGKLSVDDTLSKYFPEYEIGKDITLKNLLNMRSGIPDMVNEGYVEELSPDNSEEANTQAVKDWIFSQELKFEPDSSMSYSNSNYFLLSNIVEQVSGQKYIDFVRENIFKPLGMNNTGSVDELCTSPDWANGQTFDSLQETKLIGLSKGAGDIVTNAYDMDLWMTGLKSGKVISLESYHEMTTNYAGEYAQQYGYGLTPGIYGGAGHTGAIGTYSAFDYINDEHGYNMFLAGYDFHPNKMNSLMLRLTGEILG